MTAQYVTKPRSVLGVRHAQAALLFLAMAISFMMRVNMSTALVVMTDARLNQTYSDWSPKVQGTVLSSYFWGYIVLQLPSGFLAAAYGGKTLIALLVGINSVVSLLLPHAALYGDWAAVCAGRALQGLAQGLLYSSIHTLLSKWVPAPEKGRLGTFVYAGGQFGTALQLMSSGFIADVWGWQAIFYVNGAIGVAWTAIYLLVGAEAPATSKFISADEKYYIENTLGRTDGGKKLPTPWREMLTSLPVWALLVVHFGQNWGFWTLMTEMPTYMDKVLGVNIKTNGMLSALPYVAMYLMSFPYGFTTDLCISKKWLSVTATRKLSNSLGFYGPALALLGLSYAPAGDVVVAVVLLTAVVGLNAGQYTGYLLVHIDMSPNFAGVLMGISNFFANITGVLAPLVTSALVDDKQSEASAWRKVFFLASAMYVASNSFYVACGSSRRQRWNEPRRDDAEKDKCEMPEV